MNSIQLETKSDSITITGMFTGLLVGMYKSWQRSSLLHTIIITAAVSSIVSFIVQLASKEVQRINRNAHSVRIPTNKKPRHAGAFLS